MIVTEFFETRYDGVDLYRTYSDANKMIQKDGTKEVYSEAIDPAGTGRTYTETDMEIEIEPEIEGGEPPFLIEKED